MPFLKLKIGPFFIFGFFVFENLVLPAERRSFKKSKKRTTKTFLKLKIGPSMLRNILGPVFNFSLDQFLTLEFVICLFFLIFLGGGWNLYFNSVSAKMLNWKHYKKEKKTLFVNTLVLTVLVSAFFIFAVFRISMFLRDGFDR